MQLCAKRGQRRNGCQAQANVKQMPSAGKRACIKSRLALATVCQARENMKRVSSAGNVKRVPSARKGAHVQSRLYLIGWRNTSLLWLVRTLLRHGSFEPIIELSERKLWAGSHKTTENVSSTILRETLYDNALLSWNLLFWLLSSRLEAVLLAV